MRKEKFRILAKNHYMMNDTRITNLNNNDIIIGPSGSGKTRGYVLPNILQANESMIIADVKEILKKQTEDLLKEKGYKIYSINFMDLANSDYYNPFDFVRYDPVSDEYNIQDIKTITACLAPNRESHDPYWDSAARMYLETIIAYMFECLPKEEHTLAIIYKLTTLMDTEKFEKLFDELYELNPESFAANQYNMFKENKKAERMHACIKGILAERLSSICINIKSLNQDKGNRINFKDLGKEKIVLFTVISDTDRSMDGLANLFYTQALNILSYSADIDYPDNRLEVPVRLILDDFAANIYIPDFDKTITTIRSREIYVSVILQSISQLESAYGAAKSKTILNNADNLLYIGGQDIETSNYISVKANKSLTSILEMPLENGWLFTRGRKPQEIEKYDLCDHEEYYKLIY